MTAGGPATHCRGLGTAIGGRPVTSPATRTGPSRSRTREAALTCDDGVHTLVEKGHGRRAGGGDRDKV